MSGEPSSGTQRAGLLAALRNRPRAVLAAMASDGVLVPMPPSVDLPEFRVMVPPTDRATLLDVVLPSDQMTVITAWERVLQLGIAVATVRKRTDPETALRLTFVDLRDELGVLIGALDVLEQDEAAEAPLLADSVTVSRRPRTGTVVKSVLAVLVEVDERTTRMLGWAPEDMIGRRSSEFVHPDDQERAIANWMELLSKQETQRIRLRHLCKDGSWIWLELENQYRPADDPADALITTQMSDVSDEMAAHEALQQRERLLRRVAESLPNGIMQLASDGALVYANARLATILGSSGVTGPDDLEQAVVESDRGPLQAALADALERGTDTELEVSLRHGVTGERRTCAVNAVSLGDREGAPGALLSVTDVTDGVRMREELTARATFDVLTGCHNRASTMAILDEALDGRDDGRTAVIFIDLDNFKPINDTLGHDAGDELLALTAERVGKVLRRDDIVGRIGGDEFLIVSRGLDSVESATGLAERIRAALSEPAVLSVAPVELRASIGVACSEPGMDAATLTRRADEAMYLSKQEGRGYPVLYGETRPVPRPRDGRTSALPAVRRSATA